MYSPFYELEAKAQYPHRDVMCRTAPQVKAVIEKVIADKANTIDAICNTTLGELRYVYFPNASIAAISDGIDLYKSGNNASN